VEKIKRGPSIISPRKKPKKRTKLVNRREKGSVLRRSELNMIRMDVKGKRKEEELRRRRFLTGAEIYK